MAVNLVSPGVNVREVDLTVGRIDASREFVGAIAGPFQKGPVNEPALIENEQQLLNVFGKPQLADGQYEYWLSASNYLSYGGTLRVVRTDVNEILFPNSLINANASPNGFLDDLKITSDEDYLNNHYNDVNWYYSSRNPGSWSNDLKVCMIDSAADQTISGINTTFVSTLGFSTDFTRTNITIGIGTNKLVGIDTTGITLQTKINETASGAISFNTLITDISADDGGTITFSPSSDNTGIVTESVQFGSTIEIQQPNQLQVGAAVTQTLSKSGVEGSQVVTYNGYLRGIITQIGNKEISVKITDRVDEDGVSYPIEYKNPGANTNLNAYSFDVQRALPFFITNPSQISAVQYNSDALSLSDWYDNQTLGLTNSTIYWKNIAPKPGTSQYCSERSSTNDELHIVVVDDKGSVTGVSGNIVEKFTNISKAIDARVSPSQPIYYKDLIKDGSNYIFAGVPEIGTASGLIVTGIGTDAQLQRTSGAWGSTAQSTKFNVVGSVTYDLQGGTDYSGPGSVGGYSASVSDLITSYQIFNNPAEYGINFLINGPSSGTTIYESQAKANALIAIAQNRKDCIAVVSPHKQSVVDVTNPETQTSNIIEFFEPLTSSSYAVFDSGYKYTYDRFNNKFTYIPCNSDIAGLMARTTLNNYSWFSPAGSNRGSLNNVVKLAYNPTQAQRDQIYTKRINPIISSPGAGFILFGDKTALSYASALDRINVRRLFLTIEESIERAARAQLFEFNDVITRTNFINIVEPYLRDVKAKRGITEFLVVCDETNNTPDIIDSNQFRADIFVKPARSINFIGLTFVATRTGVSFSEVVGTV